MNAKSVITAVLLIFVAASVIGIVLRNSGADAGQNPGHPQRNAQGKADAVDESSVPEHQVVATYFHNTVRCPSCIKIEKYSREAIEEGFAEELKDGLLVYRMVNVDEDENRHFIEAYGLYTKHLVLSDRLEGRETRWKDLPQVWELLGSEDDFKTCVTQNVRLYLDGAEDPEAVESQDQG